MLESWIKSLEISQREKQTELVIGLYEHSDDGGRSELSFLEEKPLKYLLLSVRATFPAIL